MRIICLLFALAVSATTYGEVLYEFFPAEIHPAEKYVFYSHGFIVEGSNETPVHPEYGRYEFPAIKQKLFDLGGFNLIAHHRPEGTDVQQYVARLESWVKRLLDAGVDEMNITLIGFSRGSQLTARASGRLHDKQINTVLMAACIEGDIAADPPLRLGGRVLSIYEISDAAGSCENLEARSDTRTYDEIAIATGKSHGAFYMPLEEWIDPIRDWMR